MPKNKAGKHFANKFAMGRASRAEEAPESPEFESGEQEGMGEMGGPDIQDVVAQHGPAQEIHMQHDHEGGKHTVESHHGEHVHHSEHASAEEAHQHAQMASGC